MVPSAAGVTLPLLVQDRRSPQAARLPPHSRRPLRVRCMRRGMAPVGSPPLRGARWSPASTTADGPDCWARMYQLATGSGSNGRLHARFGELLFNCVHVSHKSNDVLFAIAFVL